MSDSLQGVQGGGVRKEGRKKGTEKKLHRQRTVDGWTASNSEAEGVAVDIPSAPEKRGGYLRTLH